MIFILGAGILIFSNHGFCGGTDLSNPNTADSVDRPTIPVGNDIRNNLDQVQSAISGAINRGETVQFNVTNSPIFVPVTVVKINYGYSMDGLDLLRPMTKEQPIEANKDYAILGEVGPKGGTKSDQELFQDLLKVNLDGNLNTNSVVDPAQLDQTMNAVLGVLHSGAVNQHATAAQRAIYRSWYLSLAKKARMIRLQRLQNLKNNTKPVEEPHQNFSLNK